MYIPLYVTEYVGDVEGALSKYLFSKLTEIAILNLIYMYIYILANATLSFVLEPIENGNFCGRQYAH